MGALSLSGTAPAAPDPGPGKRSHSVGTGVKMTALVATGRPGGVATVLVALLPVVFGGSLRLRHGLVNYCGYERYGKYLRYL